jgi:hypothetical protein
MRATDGIVQVARLSGCPVIPCTFSVRRRRLLGSWDRFLLALPFSQGIFVWGAPIAVPTDAGADALAAARDAVEQGLNAITADADRAMGHVPVEPAPLDPRHGGGKAAI